MDSSLLPKAAPDFTDPVGLLRACHDRILGHCCTLVRITEHLARKGVDSETTEAMAKIHRYFSTAGQHHHRDEEEDLFPRLRGRQESLDNLMDELLEQHATMDALWHTLEPLIGDRQQSISVTDFQSVVDEFVKVYRRHVITENTRLLPVAEQLLAPSEVQAIGQAMARRRTVCD